MNGQEDSSQENRSGHHDEQTQHLDVEAELERHVPRLLAYIRLQTGPELRNHEASSDLVQSVCREILQRANRFVPDSNANLIHWFYETAQRKIKDRARYWRAARRDARSLSEKNLSEVDCTSLLASYGSFASPSQFAVARERLEQIERAFDRLSQDQRQVIMLSRIMGLSHNQIAAHTERRPAAVRMLLSRALARLSSLLDIPAED